jgi:hypothetical protein
MRRYGESERNLSEIFKAAEQLGGAIIFLDEIDSLATQRRCACKFLRCPGGRKCSHLLVRRSCCSQQPDNPEQR